MKDIKIFVDRNLVYKTYYSSKSFNFNCLATVIEFFN